MPTNFTVYYETSKSQKSSNLKVCTLKNLKNSKVNVKAAKTCQPEPKKSQKSVQRERIRKIRRPLCWERWFEVESGKRPTWDIYLSLLRCRCPLSCFNCWVAKLPANASLITAAFCLSSLSFLLTARFYFAAEVH